MGRFKQTKEKTSLEVEESKVTSDEKNEETNLNELTKEEVEEGKKAVEEQLNEKFKQQNELQKSKMRENQVKQLAVSIFQSRVMANRPIGSQKNREEEFKIAIQTASELMNFLDKVELIKSK